MLTFQEIVNEAASKTTVSESLSIFINGLHDQMKIMSEVTPLRPVHIDEIFSIIENNKEVITAALVPTVVIPLSNSIISRI